MPVPGRTISTSRWLARSWPVLAAIAVVTVPATARAAGLDSKVRDTAGLFSAEAVRHATDALKAVEDRLGTPIVIETVPSLRAVTSPQEQEQWRDRTATEVVNLVAQRRDLAEPRPGLYLLIARDNKVISNVLVPKSLAARFPEERRLAIRQALESSFREGRFDEGLSGLVQSLEEFSATKSAAHPPATTPARKPEAGGRSIMSSLLYFVFLLLAALLVFRILGAIFRGIFGRGRRDYGPMPPGGYGPGGYGPGGYGYGGGGGFWPNVFGGIGGAIFGNWVYDQITGRGHHHHEPGTGTGGMFGPSNTPFGGGEILGADDNRGVGGSWGDAGGDWTSVGDGGGGDWGGGGGDWGGGGGDWGGGGGDWGGGDGGGGSW